MKEDKRLQISEDREAMRAIDEIVKNQIVFFPGSMEEYERSRGYSVEIVDTKRQDKGVIYPELFGIVLVTEYTQSEEEEKHRRTARDFVKYILDKGVEALVNISFMAKGGISGGYGGVRSSVYGLPVRKAKKSI